MSSKHKKKRVDVIPSPYTKVLNCRQATNRFRSPTGTLRIIAPGKSSWRGVLKNRGRFRRFWATKDSFNTFA